MLRISALVIIMLITVVAFNACSQNPVVLTEKDNGRTIRLNTGIDLEISLKGNPTTGFNWYVASLNSSILKQAGDSEFKSASNAIGAGGRVITRFETVKPGKTDIQLVYKRLWEVNTPPEDTFNLTVIVK